MRQFFEVFKWDNQAIYTSKLGNGKTLITATLEHQKFWDNLELKHSLLKGKYQNEEGVGSGLYKEVEQL